MTIHDRGQADSRGEAVRKLLSADSSWQKQLERRLRRPAVRVRCAPAVRRRFRVAGVRWRAQLAQLDAQFRCRGVFAACRWPACCWSPTAMRPTRREVAWDELPPVYPVVVGRRRIARRLSRGRRFRQPDELRSGPGHRARRHPRQRLRRADSRRQLIDEDGKELQTQTVELPAGRRAARRAVSTAAGATGREFLSGARVAASGSREARQAALKRRWPTTSGWSWSIAAAGRIACCTCAAGRTGSSSSCAALGGGRSIGAGRPGAHRPPRAEVRVPQPSGRIDQSAVPRLRASRRGIGRALRPAGACCGSARRTKTSCATASRRRPRSCTVTTR